MARGPLVLKERGDDKRKYHLCLVETSALSESMNNMSHSVRKNTA